MLGKIDNTWLQSFICVYEKQSFKHAADHLALPSSNISRHLQLLESEIGEKLFYRTTRKVSPTPLGEALYAKVKEPFYQLNKSIVGIMTQSDALNGTVRLSTPDIPLVGEALSEFAIQYPNMSVLCEHSTSVEKAVVADPDIIVSFERSELDELDWVSKPLCEWESSVLASPECITKYGSPKVPEELEGLPCISSYKAFGGNPWIFNNGKEDIKPLIRSQLKVDGGFIAKTLAKRGLGYVALPKQFCLEELKRGELVEIPMTMNLKPLTVYIHRRALSFHSHAAQLLATCLAKTFTQDVIS